MLVVSMTINMSQQCQCNIDAGGGGFEAGENVVYIKKGEVSKGNGKNCQCPNNFATECSYGLRIYVFIYVLFSLDDFTLFVCVCVFLLLLFFFVCLSFLCFCFLFFSLFFVSLFLYFLFMIICLIVIFFNPLY